MRTSCGSDAGSQTKQTALSLHLRQPRSICLSVIGIRFNFTAVMMPGLARFDRGEYLRKPPLVREASGTQRFAADLSLGIISQHL